jgi:hypothetical protein
MAKNLRQKIPASDRLFIQDINTAATKQFTEEMSEYNVEVVDTVRDIAENSVCIRRTPFPFFDLELPMMNLYFPFHV